MDAQAPGILWPPGNGVDQNANPNAMPGGGGAGLVGNPIFVFGTPNQPDPNARAAGPATTFVLEQRTPGQPIFGGNGDRVGGPPPMAAQIEVFGAHQFVPQPIPLGPPAVNFNQQPPNAFGGAVAGVFAGFPPAAQLQTPQQFNGLPRPGSLALIGGRMRRPHPVADDSLQIDLIELYQRFPTPRRRRGFSQGMLINVLTLRTMLQFEHLIK